MLAVCWLGWQSQPAELQSHWQTGVGQFASYQLPDGSEIKLDAATALEVHYGADERQVLQVLAPLCAQLQAAGAELADVLSHRFFAHASTGDELQRV